MSPIHFFFQQQNTACDGLYIINISKKNDNRLKKLKNIASDDGNFVNILFDAMLENTSWDSLFVEEKYEKMKVKAKFQTTVQYSAIKSK